MDPLVSLMMVEKVPDSTYEMVGGLDKQIKEIKEVCPFPFSILSFHVPCCTCMQYSVLSTSYFMYNCTFRSLVVISWY